MYITLISNSKHLEARAHESKEITLLTQENQEHFDLAEIWFSSAYLRYFQEYFFSSNLLFSHKWDKRGKIGQLGVAKGHTL